MRIAIVSLNFNTVSGGGSHHTLSYLLKKLVKKSHEVKLITLYSEDNKFEMINSVSVIQQNITGSFLEQQKEVCNLMLNADQDLFIMYGPSFVWAGGMYKRSGGKAAVASYINNYTPGMNMVNKNSRSLLHMLKMRVWEKAIGIKLVKRIDALIFDSPVIKNNFEEFGYNAKKTTICPEFVHIEDHEVSLNGRNSSELKVLYTGRLTKDKGVEILLLALAESKHRDKIKVEIVGKGPEKNHLISIIKKFNLKSVDIHDWVNQDELKNFYSKADIFAQPSRWPEPFGRTALEAMSWGLPIITTEWSGSAWVAGEAGLILKSTKPKELAELLDGIASKKTSLVTWREKAINRSKYFKPEKHFDNLNSFIVKLTEKAVL